MRIDYNPETKIVTAGIRDLISFGNLPESLVPGPYIDLQVRNRIHTGYQRRKSRTRGIKTEVSVILIRDISGLTFCIRGRIDLLDERSETRKVTEVKTVAWMKEDPDPVSDYHDYVLQLAFYCRALVQMNPKDPQPEGNFVFITVREKPVREIICPVDIFSEQIENMWKERLEYVAAYIRKEQQWRNNQVVALEGFSFPYEEKRPGQERMQELSWKSTDRTTNLLIEAPTGIGKTAAAICGVLPEIIQNDLFLFFLTAKGTQVHNVCVTVDRIIDSGLPLRCIVLTAREKICPLPAEDCCHPEDCRYAKEYASGIREHRIMERLLQHGKIYPDKLLELALEAEVCPFELSLDLSVHCDLIVCDYNYVFDPHVYLRRFFQDDVRTASKCVLLVDEAGNLPGRAREYYSPEIRESWLKGFSELEPKTKKKIQRLLTPWRKTFKELKPLLSTLEKGSFETELPPDTELPINEDSWRKFIEKMETSPASEVLEFFRSVLDFAMIRDLNDSRFHLLLRKNGRDTMLQWFCTDASSFLRERHQTCRNTIGFSATLTPFEHYSDLLGFDSNEIDTERLPYPFPEENIGVWIDPRIDTRFRQRKNSLAMLAGRIISIYHKAPGTYLLFFPSYAYLQMASEILESSGLPLLIQKRGMTTEERKQFLDKVRTTENMVLTVSGGIFAEGIDIRAPHLRGAMIIGPCLPGMDLRSKLLSERFEEMEKQGFLHTSVIPGMNRVIQAAGRLIRSAEDRGTIILFGRRFLYPPYSILIPEHWKKGDRVTVLSENLTEIENFWK